MSFTKYSALLHCVYSAYMIRKLEEVVIIFIETNGREVLDGYEELKHMHNEGVEESCCTVSVLLFLAFIKLHKKREFIFK